MGHTTADEIVEEIHTIRLEHAARFGFDIARIIADLKMSEQTHTEQGWPLIRKQEHSRPDKPFRRVRFAHR